MKKVLALVTALTMMMTLCVVALNNGLGVVAYGFADGKGAANEDYVLVTEPLDTNRTYTEAELMTTNGIKNIHVGDTAQVYFYIANRANKDAPYSLTRYTGGTWKSDNTSAATVSSSGLVTAVSTGSWSIASAVISVEIPEGNAKFPNGFYYTLNFRVLAENVDESDLDVDVVLAPADDPSLVTTTEPYTLEMTVGQTIQLGAFVVGSLEPYNGDVRWEETYTYCQDIISVTSTGRVTAIAKKFDMSDEKGPYARGSLGAEVPGAKWMHSHLEIKVRKGDGNTPVTPEDPDKPTPKPPVVDSGAAPDKAPQATDNAANEDKTTDALASGKSAEVKVTNGSAALSVDTANALGGGSGRLTLRNGGMTVTLPGGFGKVTEAGRVYYPFDYETSPKHASEMLAAVKTEGAKSEAVKAGGAMTLPTAATVTLKTRLTGTVNIYLYDEDTGKFTLIASPAAKDGTVTFTTRRMGCFLLTTGRV